MLRENVGEKYCDGDGREYYFDNAKFILILLVVIAHMLSPLSAKLWYVKDLGLLLIYFICQPLY